MGLRRVEFSNIFPFGLEQDNMGIHLPTDMVTRSIQCERSQSSLAGWVCLPQRQDRWVWILLCRHFCISELCLTQDCKGKLQWWMTWHFCDICFCCNSILPDITPHKGTHMENISLTSLKTDNKNRLPELARSLWSPGSLLWQFMMNWWHF